MPLRQTLAHEPLSEESVAAGGSDRSFGCTVGGILTALGGLKGWLAGGLGAVAALLLAAGLLLLLAGIAAPARLAPFHRAWLRLGGAISAVANPVVMAVLFAAVITPMALVMRLSGKRPLHLRPDPAAATYWLPRQEAPDAPASMRRQF